MLGEEFLVSCISLQDKRQDLSSADGHANTPTSRKISTYHLGIRAPGQFLNHERLRRVL